MELLLFSELVKKSRVKPDQFISSKIDEIDFPLKHIKFIKKNINYLMFESFNEIIDTQRKILDTTIDYYNEPKTSLNILVDIDDNQIQISINKTKKECLPVFNNSKKNFSDEVFSDNFIDEINKHYILISLICGISMEESHSFISNNKDELNLNSRFIYNELLSFWTNNFKNDFCYFENNNNLNFEQNELEFCLIQFYYNHYKRNILDLSIYSDEERNVLEHLIEDRSSYKWYVLFGHAIWKRIKNKFKNPEDTTMDGLLKLSELDYKILNKILDDMVN